MTTRASDDAWVRYGGARLQHQVPGPDHPAEAAPRQAMLEAARPIVVGDNVWLGDGEHDLDDEEPGPVASSTAQRGSGTRVHEQHASVPAPSGPDA